MLSFAGSEAHYFSCLSKWSLRSLTWPFSVTGYPELSGTNDSPLRQAGACSGTGSPGRSSSHGASISSTHRARTHRSFPPLDGHLLQAQSLFLPIISLQAQLPVLVGAESCSTYTC